MVLIPCTGQVGSLKVIHRENSTFFFVCSFYASRKAAKTPRPIQEALEWWDESHSTADAKAAVWFWFPARVRWDLWK